MIFKKIAIIAVAFVIYGCVPYTQHEMTKIEEQYNQYKQTQQNFFNKYSTKGFYFADSIEKPKKGSYYFLTNISLIQNLGNGEYLVSLHTDDTYSYVSKTLLIKNFHNFDLSKGMTYNLSDDNVMLFKYMGEYKYTTTNNSVNVAHIFRYINTFKWKDIVNEELEKKYKDIQYWKN